MAALHAERELMRDKLTKQEEEAIRLKEELDSAYAFAECSQLSYLCTLERYSRHTTQRSTLARLMFARTPARMQAHMRVAPSFAALSAVG